MKMIDVILAELDQEAQRHPARARTRAAGAVVVAAASQVDVARPARTARRHRFPAWSPSSPHRHRSRAAAFIQPEAATPAELVPALDASLAKARQVLAASTMRS